MQQPAASCGGATSIPATALINLHEPWGCETCFRRFNKCGNHNRHKRKNQCVPRVVSQGLDVEQKRSELDLSISEAKGWEPNKAAVFLPPGVGVDVPVRTWRCETCNRVSGRKGEYTRHTCKMCWKCVNTLEHNLSA
jgi:hypothetical protein